MPIVDIQQAFTQIIWKRSHYKMGRLSPVRDIPYDLIINDLVKSSKS